MRLAVRWALVVFASVPVAFVAAATGAHAAPLVSVYVDCYLTTTLSCTTLKKSWRGLLLTEPTLARETADVVVRVRAFRTAAQDQYELRFEGREPLTSFTLRDAQLKFAQSLDPRIARQALDRQFLRGMLLYHELLDYEVLEDGTIRTTLAGVEAEDSGASADQAGVFVFTSLGLETFGADPRRFSSFSWASVGYDSPEWLLESGLFVNAQYIRQELEDRVVEGENLRFGNFNMASRSLGAHFAPAFFFRTSRDPAANLRSRIQGHAGIEYEMIQIVEENDSAFTANYLVGADYERYRYPNATGAMSAWVPTHAAGLNFLHHFDALDLKAFGVVASVVHEPKRYALGALASATAYPTPDFSIALMGSIGFRDNAINAPDDPEDIPEGVRLLGAVSGITPLTYNLGVKVNYAFGSSLLRERDSRWKFSDLNVGF